MAEPRAFGPRELFRYTHIRPFEVIDIAQRASADAELHAVLASSPDEKMRWARTFIHSGAAVRGPRDLKTPVLAHLKPELLERPYLPTAEEIGEVGNRRVLAESETYKGDLRNCLRSLAALTLVRDHEGAERASRLLQVAEAIPRPDKRTGRRRFVQAVLRTPSAKPTLPQEGKKDRQDRPESRGDTPKVVPGTIKELAQNIEILWRARTSEWKDLRKQVAEMQRRPRSSPTVPERPKGMTEKEAQEEARRYLKELRERRERLAAERLPLRRLEGEITLADTLAAPAERLAPHAKGKDAAAIGAAQKHVQTLMGAFGMKGVRFCEAYEEALTVLDKGAKDAPAFSLDAGCFTEHPKLSDGTSVRLLPGHASLIKVEETFVGYSEGEISYVENILAGEVRRREVKSTKYFEQLQETTTEEVSDLSEEKSTTTSQDLSTEVQSEVETRMQGDVNASASGSGGGSLGVVDFEGSGSLATNLGFGVDTRHSSSSESKFSQEIVSKAVERTRKTTLKRRVDRTYALYQTHDLHRIDNSGGGNAHRRGVYVFLDKHVCISETTYGHRAFLMANVMAPAKNLLCEFRAREGLALADRGARPVFDTTLEDVQPGTYMDLVARYKATNVQPPPEPVARLARTYKTDQASASQDAPGGSKLAGVTDFLVPLFQRYKGFMITDTIRIPDGYEVQAVQVTVNHGANGVSIPAHLPLKLYGTYLYGVPLLTTSVMSTIYLVLPVVVWHLMQAASPLLHYNIDSSNVTVCVGNESQDSPYFFFSPETLLAEVVEFLSNLSMLGPGLLGRIQALAQQLFVDLQANATSVPGEVATDIQRVVTDIFTQLRAIFTAIGNALDPKTGEVVPSFNTPGGELAILSTAITKLATSVTVNMTSLSAKMATFFAPLQQFIRSAFEEIATVVDSSLSDFISTLVERFISSDVMYFADSFGARTELPVSLNTVAINPGVTVNLVACLRRTERALEQWRLETFGALYHAYLQQLAEYEAWTPKSIQKDGLTQSPATMREKERRVMKEQVLHALSGLHPTGDGAYTVQRLSLFEHGIDWENMSYRLFNYGPSEAEVRLEADGLFHATDARRRAFLTAPWAQVLIPLSGDERLERAVVRYMDTGRADLEAEIPSEELAAFYQDLILSRRLTEEEPLVVHRPAILPTDIVVLMPDDKLPSNPDACPAATPV